MDCTSLSILITKGYDQNLLNWKVTKNNTNSEVHMRFLQAIVASPLGSGLKFIIWSSQGATK